MGWLSRLTECLYICGGAQESEFPYPGSDRWRCGRGLESKPPDPTNSLPSWVRTPSLLRCILHLLT